jgi:hypothetical protein
MGGSKNGESLERKGKSPRAGLTPIHGLGKVLAPQVYQYANPPGVDRG